MREIKDKMGIAIIEFLDFERSKNNGINNIIRQMTEELDFKWKIYGLQEHGMKTFSLDNTNVQIQNLGNKVKWNILQKIVPNSLWYVINLAKKRNLVSADFIHCHRVEIGFIVILLFPQIPLIQFIHNNGRDLTSRKSSSKWRYLRRFHILVTRFVYRRAARVLLFNEAEYKNASKLSNEIVRCYSWYDDKVFFASSEPKRCSLNSNKNIKLMWLGRFEKEKDPLLAIQIVDGFRNSGFSIELRMFGYGSLCEAIKSEILSRDLGNSISLYSNASKQEIAECMRSSDVMIQTSKYEGSPTSLVESLATGLPVVSTLEGDPDKVILDGVNGYVVSERNAETFVNPIINSLDLDRFVILATVKNRAKSSYFKDFQKVIVL